MIDPNTLTLEEYKQHKLKMQHDMRDALHGIVQEFQEKTGLTPHSIDVYLNTLELIGDPRPVYEVSSVYCEIDIK